MPKWQASALALLVCACESRPVAKAVQDHAPAEQTSSRWHYLPTLEAALPEAATPFPLLEVELSRQGGLLIVAVLDRPGSPPGVELFRFDQNNPRQQLELAAEPEILQTIPPRQTPALAQLRRTLAAPNTAVRRSPGVPATTSTEYLQQMRAHLAVYREETRPGEQRARALADFLLGVDEELWLDIAKFEQLLDLFAGETRILSESQPGPRRIEARLASGTSTWDAELLRRSDGYVLAALRAVQGSAAPAAEPSPTAPLR